ncbi:MAG: hypothetical protein ACQETF_10415, partial [Bacteroidota bacterium]
MLHTASFLTHTSNPALCSAVIYLRSISLGFASLTQGFYKKESQEHFFPVMSRFAFDFSGHPFLQAM